MALSYEQGLSEIDSFFDFESAAQQSHEVSTEPQPLSESQNAFARHQNSSEEVGGQGEVESGGQSSMHETGEQGLSIYGGELGMDDMGQQSEQGLSSFDGGLGANRMEDSDMGWNGSQFDAGRMHDQNVGMYGDEAHLGQINAGSGRNQVLGVYKGERDFGMYEGHIEPAATPAKPQPKPAAMLSAPKNSPSSLPSYKKRPISKPPSPPPEPATSQEPAAAAETASSRGKLSLHREMRNEEEAVDGSEETQETGSEEDAPSSPLTFPELLAKTNAAQQKAANVTKYLNGTSFAAAGVKRERPASMQEFEERSQVVMDGLLKKEAELKARLKATPAADGHISKRKKQPDSRSAGHRGIGRKEIDALEIEPESRRQTRAQKEKAPNAAAAAKKRHGGK